VHRLWPGPVAKFERESLWIALPQAPLARKSRRQNWAPHRVRIRAACARQWANSASPRLSATARCAAHSERAGQSLKPDPEPVGLRAFASGGWLRGAGAAARASPLSQCLAWPAADPQRRASASAGQGRAGTALLRRHAAPGLRCASPLRCASRSVGFAERPASCSKGMGARSGALASFFVFLKPEPLSRFTTENQK